MGYKFLKREKHVEPKKKKPDDSNSDGQSTQLEPTEDTFSEAEEGKAGKTPVKTPNNIVEVTVDQTNEGTE